MVMVVRLVVMVVGGDGGNDSGNANDDDHNQQEEEDAAAAAMMNSDKAAEVKKVEVVVDPVQANKSKEQVRFILQWGNICFLFLRLRFRTSLKKYLHQNRIYDFSRIYGDGGENSIST